jgi:hypothetical protein
LNKTETLSNTLSSDVALTLWFNNFFIFLFDNYILLYLIHDNVFIWLIKNFSTLL